MVETGSPRRVETRGRQDANRRRRAPQGSNEGFKLALDVGEGDRLDAVFQGVQGSGIEQSEKFKSTLRIVFRGANSAERPGFERTKVKAFEQPARTFKQQANGFRRTFSDTSDHTKPF